MSATETPQSSRLRDLFLEYQHVVVLALPPLFMTGLLFAQPNPAGYWLQYWWMFLVAVTGATIVNMVGISGSALFVPFFIFLFPVFAGESLPPEQLVKVGLIMETFGLSSSAFAFARYGLIDYRVGGLIVLGALPFVIGGSLLSFVVPAWIFYLLLAGVLVVSAYILYANSTHEEDMDETVFDTRQAAEDGVGQERRDRDGNTYRYHRSGYSSRFGNYGVGALFQGLAGFGIGEVGIISMLRTDIPTRMAIGTNHVVVATTALIASVTHVFVGPAVIPGAHDVGFASTPWNIVFVGVPGTVVGGQLAPYITSRVPTHKLKSGVSGLFLVLGIALLGLAAINVL